MLEPCRWGRKLCTGTQGALPRHLDEVQLPEGPRLRLPRWCGCRAEHQRERSCPGQAAEPPAEEAAKTTTWRSAEPLQQLLHYGVCWSHAGGGGSYAQALRELYFIMQKRTEQKGFGCQTGGTGEAGASNKGSKRIYSQGDHHALPSEWGVPLPSPDEAAAPKSAAGPMLLLPADEPG